MRISPSSVPYEIMKPNDIVYININQPTIVIGSKTNHSYKKKPSSEWLLHLEILKSRPDINAILHCHSTYATALACHRRSIPSFHYMTAIAGGNDIRCANYSTFGTPELSKKAIKALKDRYACLLAHHGQLAIAGSLQRALQIAEEVETLSKMYLISLQLGEPNNLSKIEMKKVLEKFNSLGYGGT